MDDSDEIDFENLITLIINEISMYTKKHKEMKESFINPLIYFNTLSD